MSGVAAMKAAVGRNFIRKDTRVSIARDIAKNLEKDKVSLNKDIKQEVTVTRRQTRSVSLCENRKDSIGGDVRNDSFMARSFTKPDSASSNFSG